jgi:hypothetical protein
MIGDTLQKKDFEDLVKYLNAQARPFFVMGDTTILYGLLRTHSPQPLLYFQPNHSFLQQEIPALDQRITAALVSNDVQIVVREKATFLLENKECYQTFPRLWAWFTTGFQHTVDYGNYEVWERRGLNDGAATTF